LNIESYCISVAMKLSDLDWDMERLVVAEFGSGIIVHCITWDTANNHLCPVLVMMMMVVVMIADDHDDDYVV
jgi:hypothetical protein